MNPLPDEIEVDFSPFYSSQNESSEQGSLPDEIQVDFSKFYVPEEIQQQTSVFDEENNLERDIERNIARGTSRILETGLGTLGNIESILPDISSGVLGRFIKNLTGSQTVFPTSENIREK